eukprot:7378292-Pyramimonas_sp.AAC.1
MVGAPRRCSSAATCGLSARRCKRGARVPWAVSASANASATPPAAGSAWPRYDLDAASTNTAGLPVTSGFPVVPGS